MAANDFQIMDEMLSIVGREVTISLRKISRQCFDQTFKQVFLGAVNDRVALAYSKFEIEFQLLSKGSACSETGSSLSRGFDVGVGFAEKASNHSNGFDAHRSDKIERIIQIIDSDDEEDVKIVPKEEPNQGSGQRQTNAGSHQVDASAEQSVASNGLIDTVDSSAIYSMGDGSALVDQEIAGETVSTVSEISSQNNNAMANVEKATSSRESNLKRRDQTKKVASARNAKGNAVNKSKRHKCNICQYASEYKGDLNKHMRSHTGERPYPCGQCPKSFRKSSQLKDHQLVHAKQYEFHCVGCAAGFGKRSEKLAHDRICKQSRYECFICQFATRNRMNLKIHMRIHTGEKPYLCEICMKCFAHKGNLKRHLETNHGKSKT